MLAASYDAHVLVCVESGNNIGEEGAEALGPHLAKLSKMAKLNLAGPWLLMVGACGGWWRDTYTSVCLAGNLIGEEGAQALGPYLAKLSNMTELHLGGACFP